MQSTPERNAEYIRFRKKCERRNPWQRVGEGLKVSKEDTRNFAKLLKHGMSEKRSMRLNDLSFHLSCSKFLRLFELSGIFWESKIPETVGFADCTKV